MNGTIQNRPGPRIAVELAEPEHDRALPLLGDLRRLRRDDAREAADDGGNGMRQDEPSTSHPDRTKGARRRETRRRSHGSSFLSSLPVDAPSAPR